MAAATPPPLASPTLNIIIFTDKPSYIVEESITVYGNLTYDGAPVQDWPIALEIQDSYSTPVITRTLKTDTNGVYNLTFKLPANSKLGTYTVYVSTHYKGETDTSNTSFELIQIVQTTMTIEGKDYTIMIESNATITNVTTAGNTLRFTSSGRLGHTAYVNVTSPVELNKTEIKVSIDNVELTPPPFPMITSNGTHYFVYLEFILSTHNITIKYAIADIAVTDVTPAKTVVGQGYTIRMNVTIKNQGDYEENFNITIYANTTSIGSQSVTLPSGDSATLTLTWNTTGVAKGNYTITAEATILPGETDLDDNTLTDGWVVVTIPGDINGDGFVNVLDYVLVKKAIPSYPGHPKWNPNADTNSDGFVNVKDMILTKNNIGKSW